MKKFISLLIGCAFALAGGAAMAQTATTEQSPATTTTQEAPQKGHKGNKANRAEKANAAASSDATATNPDAATGGGAKQGSRKAERRAAKMQNAEAPTSSATSATTTDTNVSGQATTNEGKQGRKGKRGRGADAQATSATTPVGATGATGTSADTNVQTGAGGPTTVEGKHGKHGKNARGETGMTKPMASATPVVAASASATPVAAASAAGTPVVTASASASVAPSVAASGQLNTQTTTATNTGVRGPKPDRQKVMVVKQKEKVEQIKQQHVNFRAQARPDRVPTVTFNQSYRIQGSDHWQGQKYEVFRSYRPERHDQGWYRQHYSRVELVGGGYYYMQNGYWYPAWGYSPREEYYAYDGPIYVGRRAEPPDRVIADVQASLQEMGYYTGEVDGLLGPLTREALTAYQADEGLATTAAIDEPTLDSLNMG